MRVGTKNSSFINMSLLNIQYCSFVIILRPDPQSMIGSPQAMLLLLNDYGATV